MCLEITSPEEFTGNIINNISNRRGRLDSMDMENNTQIIKGYVPLAELFGYSTVLDPSPRVGPDFPCNFPITRKTRTLHRPWLKPVR